MIPELSGDFLQWLRGFYYTSQAGGLSGAVAHMGRNQPALSHQIKCLESELGVVLFDRSRGRMELTAEGRELLPQAIAVFELIKEMKEKARGGLPLRGRITIATTHAVLLYFLPKPVAGFRVRHPLVTFGLEGGGLDFILSQVESAQADFGIASLDGVPDHLEFRPLFSTRLALIAPRRGLMKADRPPNLAALAKLPFIAFPSTSSIAPLVERRFAREGLELNIVQVLNNFELVKRYVELGMGVAILDEYALSEEDERKLLVFTLERYFAERPYGVITRRRPYVSPALRAFLKTLRGEE